MSISFDKDFVEDYNFKVFSFLSKYLNEKSNFISKEDITEMKKCGISSEYAFASVLASAMGLDIENPKMKMLFENYFLPLFHSVSYEHYIENEYYKNIKLPEVKFKDWEIKYDKYESFEGFVYDDIKKCDNGILLPQIGFFEEEFKYPAILQNNRIWMTVTPNEIETMKNPIKKSFGKVLTFGLGLGYFPYMVSEKSEVDSVTIVEMDKTVIELFNTYILPTFDDNRKKKINIINAEAFEFFKTEMKSSNFDYAFIDLWHDVSDGLPIYLKMKKIEKQNSEISFDYWIEESLKCYL